MKHGNFTGLAEKYSAFRPSYSYSVLNSLVALLGKSIQACHIADIGAGTGIWTRMLSENSPASLVAIEPNDDMRSFGIKDSESTNIVWKSGSAEHTGLADHSVDMVSMASSFHWADFDKACHEFHRILKENGRFVALWNPRLVEANPILQEAEEYLKVLKPDIKRVSSGKSGITETIVDKLYATELFTDVIYVEGRHTVSLDPKTYIGAWRSVNDVQFQLGADRFEQFIVHLNDKIGQHSAIDVTYLTRAWSALKL